MGDISGGPQRSGEALLETCEQALNKRPEDLALLKQRAALLQELRGDAQILRSYEAILQVDPFDWNAWRQKAFLLGRSGRYEEELDCWDRLLAALPRSAVRTDPQATFIPATEWDEDPDHSDAYYLQRRAYCLKELGRLEEALECLRKAESLNPENVWIAADRGKVLMQTCRWEEAAGAYDRAVRINPDDMAASFSKALCLARVGQYQAAAEALDESHFRGKDMLDPLILRPFVKFQLGDREGATAALHAFLSDAPFFYPLDDDGRSVCGLAAEEEYRALAGAIYESYASLRESRRRKRRELLDRIEQHRLDNEAG